MAVTVTVQESGTYYVDVSAKEPGRYGLSAIVNSAGIEPGMDFEMAIGSMGRGSAAYSKLDTAASVTWGFSATKPSSSKVAGLLFDPTPAYYKAAREMLASIADVANISFTELTPGKPTDKAQLQINVWDKNIGGGDASVSRGTGQVNVSAASDERYANGHDYFGTLYHEMGHIMGIEHMHGSIVDPKDNGTLNDHAVSVTSFNAHAYPIGHNQYAFANTPLLYDIYYLQKVYGVNTTTRTGDTVYGFHTNTGLDIYDFAKNATPVMALWDAGGIDTLDVSGFATNQQINLNEGEFSSVGQLSYNVAIAYGAVIENAIGGAGSDTLVGNAAQNDLRGGAGDDTLDGRAGADRLIGGLGNDVYIVDNSGDFVDESYGDGIDAVRSSVNFDLTKGQVQGLIEQLILTGSGNISASGDDLDNSITGNAGSNVLEGGGGNDILDGGMGADRLAGGDGNDTYVVDNAGDSVIEFGSGVDLVQSSVSFNLADVRQVIGLIENLTLTGGANIDGTGNELDNVLTGNAGSNRLDGGSGNDVLDGGSGADTMLGGAGDDIYRVDNTGDSVDETDGSGTDLVQSVVSFSLATTNGAVENLALLGSDDIVAIGNRLDNVLKGNSGNNLLDGGAGNDSMYGGDGDDRYHVDSTNDVVDESSAGGNDTVEATLSYALVQSDRLRGAVENLVLTGDADIDGTGNDLDNLITGNAGNNVLEGRGGNDILDGGAGADILAGSDGDDTYVVDNAGDAVIEFGSGVDLVRSSVSFNLADVRQVIGLIENLALTGGSDIDGTGNELDNVIAGNAGSNTLTGGAGNDTLDGRAGADRMIGGVGNDTHVVDTALDQVDEAEGDGIDEVKSSITIDLRSNSVRGRVENLTLTGTADINGTGNDLDNSLNGNAGNNVLIGRAGNDRIDGGAGADRLIGGRGDDTYVVDDANDEVDETSGNGVDTVLSFTSLDLSAEKIRGQVENLGLIGNAKINGTGNDLDNIIIGNAAGNVLDGGAGNDKLDGGAGADSLIGGLGDDTYIVDDAFDLVDENGGNGHDLVEASISFHLNQPKQSTGNVEDLTLTGAANIDGEGNRFANYLKGNAGNNSLRGNDGDDIIDGGDGVDQLYGGNGSDTFIVDSIDDVIDAGSQYEEDVIQSSVSFTLASKKIKGYLHRLTLTDEGGDINATGANQKDILIGNAGNNVLDGGTDTDKMIGGDGNDTYIVDKSDDVVDETGTGGHDTVRASSSYSLSTNAKGAVEDLVLTGTDAINGTGNDLDNVITGNAASNVLNGGAGADRLIGGFGDDTYVVDNSADHIDETAADGRDLVKSSISFDLTKQITGDVEDLVLTGKAVINGTGNDLDNVITGNDANNVLAGGAGNDTIDGGAGDDVIYGGAGVDHLDGGRGNDTFFVDSTDDFIDAGPANVYDEDEIRSSVSFSLADTVKLTGFLHRLTLTGGGDIDATGAFRKDILIGNAGNNVLDGGKEADQMIGGDGNDTYIVDRSDDVVDETKTGGHDTVRASSSYSLSTNAKGAVEDLVLTGTDAINGAGNDLDNVITGNAASNVLTGGLGRDVFVFDQLLLNDGSNVDTIKDFSVKDDTLRLDHSIFAALAPGGPLSADALRIGTAAVSSTDRIIYNRSTGALSYDPDGAGGQTALKFANLSKGLELTSSNFRFG